MSVADNEGQVANIINQYVAPARPGRARHLAAWEPGEGSNPSPSSGESAANLASSARAPRIFAQQLRVSARPSSSSSSNSSWSSEEVEIIGLLRRAADQIVSRQCSCACRSERRKEPTASSRRPAQDGDHCAAPEIEAAVNLNDAGVLPGRQCGCSRKRLGNKYRLLPALAYEDRAEHLEGLWQVVSHKSPELAFPFG
jgi:hypothetical protein